MFKNHYFITTGRHQWAGKVVSVQGDTLTARLYDPVTWALEAEKRHIRLNSLDIITFHQEAAAFRHAIQNIVNRVREARP